MAKHICLLEGPAGRREMKQLFEGGLPGLGDNQVRDTLPCVYGIPDPDVRQCNCIIVFFPPFCF